MKEKIFIILKKKKYLYILLLIISVLIIFSFFLIKKDNKNNTKDNYNVKIKKKFNNEEKNDLNNLLNNYVINKTKNNLLKKYINYAKIDLNTQFPVYLISFQDFFFIKNNFQDLKKEKKFFFDKSKEIYNKNLCFFKKEKDIKNILKYLKINNYKIINYFDFNNYFELKNFKNFNGILFTNIPSLSYSYYKNSKISKFSIFCNKFGQLVKYNHIIYYNNKNNYYYYTYIVRNNKLSNIILNYSGKIFKIYKKEILDKNGNLYKFQFYIYNKKTNEKIINIEYYLSNNTFLYLNYKYLNYKIIYKKEYKNNDYYYTFYIYKDIKNNNIISNYKKGIKYVYIYNGKYFELIKKIK